MPTDVAQNRFYKKQYDESVWRLKETKYTDESHYIFDKRVGSACTINGKNTYSEFNADFISMLPTSGIIDIAYLQQPGKATLFSTYNEFNLSSMLVTFYVGGWTKDDLDMKCARLIHEAKECVIKTEDDDFEYVCLLTRKAVIPTGINFWNQVDLTFVTIKRYPLKRAIIDKQNYILRNTGSEVSGVRYIITTISDIASYTINDITISNILAHLPFTIDGIYGTIEQNGINRFMDTDLINFPKVVPGDNMITTSTLTNISLIAEWYPLFAY